MSPWKTILDKLQIDELKSLNVVEQVMKEQERTQRNDRSTEDWFLLAITLAIFALIAWRLWR